MTRHLYRYRKDVTRQSKSTATQVRFDCPSKYGHVVHAILSSVSSVIYLSMSCRPAASHARRPPCASVGLQCYHPRFACSYTAAGIVIAAQRWSRRHISKQSEQRCG